MFTDNLPFYKIFYAYYFLEYQIHNALYTYNSKIVKVFHP